MVTNNYFRKRYQEFVENVPGGYFVYTADEKEMIIAANTECLKIFQCETLEEFMHLVKGSFKNFVYEEDYVQATNRINMQIHQDATGYDHVVYRIVRSDGAIRWIDDYGHLVNDAKYGKVFHVFISDITDEVNNFDWMNKNHLLAFINEGIPGGYYKCYKEEGYPFEFMSRKFLEMLDYNRAEIHTLFQNKYLNLVHPDDREKVIAYANSLLEKPGVNLVSEEYRVYGKNGYVWIVESAQALVSGDEMLFQGIIIDVSKQRELNISNQMLEEKIETMDVFKTLADDYFDAHFVDGETGIAMAYRLAEWEKSVWNIQVGKKYPYQTMMETFISEVVVGEYKSELREYVDYKAVMNQLEEVHPLPIIKQFKCKRADDELYFQIKISASYKDG
ncbi:MAG: PAS domain-containing protein, partial [Lachnospiraceae bacterium]|nr:PAS domain-containing protein [Lachnospiraceae bacterium]